MGVARTLLLLACVAFVAAVVVQARGAETNGRGPLIVEGTAPSDVFGLNRSVEVRGQVKHGVVTFGGDVIVVGRVEGDVAAIGGNVIQRRGSFIGGDVMVIGGTYRREEEPEGEREAGRDQASKTVMIAGYEDELREALRNPLSLLTPRWSLSYAGLRLLAILFWYVSSLALTAATPGAVSRAATRLQLTNTRVAVIGVVGALVIALGVPVGLRVMPTAIGGLILIAATLLTVVAYLFGRVVIHATTGRFLQRRFFAEGSRSEATALLIGTVFWVVVLSLPFVWPVLILGLVILGLGLALTARYRIYWKRAGSH